MWPALIAFASLALLLLAPRAAADEAANRAALQCDQRPAVIKQLARRFAETPVAIGLAVNGSVVEVLASEAGASWTIIITMPSGLSCLMASGQGWESLPPSASLAGPDS
jgi:hypothetical protein